jgi:large subunit ribosomal protein L17
MRHRKKGKKLGRTNTHRKRTLQALSNALIENKRITTTLAKAKALRPFVEPLITRAKEDTEHNRRQVFRHLQNKQAVRELFDEVSSRVGDRPGGYTRIIRAGRRSGDGAELALIELVDYNDVPPEDGSGGRSRTRRGSGKGRRKESQPQDPSSADAEDAPAEADAEAETADVETAEAEAPDAEAPDAEAADAEAADAEAADAETAEASPDADESDEGGESKNA